MKASIVFESDNTPRIDMKMPYCLAKNILVGSVIYELGVA